MEGSGIGPAELAAVAAVGEVAGPADAADATDAAVRGKMVMRSAGRKVWP